ncbi:MAG: putative Glucose-6-phosphate isomerase (modular protein) [Chloroflexi bacterium]|nr:putative Glucose-6-phosphate isomerase (modular protein) [Chloroflexota bacterium]
MRLPRSAQPSTQAVRSVNRVEASVGGAYTGLVSDALNELNSRGAVARIWARDASLWTDDPARQHLIEQRLGWLTVADLMADQALDLASFALEVAANWIEHVVLCGMGGSSLCPEVLRRSFTGRLGYPRLWVLDSTDPETVDRVARATDPERTLYVIASKSGGTIEVDSLFRTFFARAQQALGDEAGEHFIAITDPKTSLERLGQESGFRRVFINPPDIGGRYSALSYFGMVPAALVGVELGDLLARARAMAAACSAEGAGNPGLNLGAAMVAMARTGRDKLTILTSPSVAGFGLWAEQLVAESTGKEGRGIIPVAGELPGSPAVYGADRFFVVLRVDDDDNEELDDTARNLTAAGQPLLTLPLRDVYDLGAEFFRWEFATAVVGAGLGINPFDEPNVQESKDNTARVLAEYERSGQLPEEAPTALDAGLAVYGADGPTVREALGAFLAAGLPGDYVSLMAYLPMVDEIDDELAILQQVIRDRTHLATTRGFGPRFLHSTGQLHKGGPNSGVFIQLTTDDETRVAIPQRPYDFGVLKAAQAAGDLQSLREHGRRVIRVHLGADAPGGVKRLTTAVSASVPDESVSPLVDDALSFVSSALDLPR